MANNAFEGARYYDSVMNDQFVIVSIDPDTEDSVDPHDIDVTVEYDGAIGELTMSLAEFRSFPQIEVLDIPDDA